MVFRPVIMDRMPLDADHSNVRIVRDMYVVVSLPFSEFIIGMTAPLYCSGR